MPNNVSGYGLSGVLIASVTFPQGIELTAFADDSDPLESAATAIAEAAMGLNGDLVTWSKATPIPAVLALIPGSIDALNMGALYDANRPGPGKAPAGDVLTLTITYPDDSVVTVTGGVMLSGPPLRSVASSGKQKPAVYTLAFEDKVEV